MVADSVIVRVFEDENENPYLDWRILQMLGVVKGALRRPMGGAQARAARW
jgi:hypothetical protein